MRGWKKRDREVFGECEREERAFGSLREWEEVLWRVRKEKKDI